MFVRCFMKMIFYQYFSEWPYDFECVYSYTSKYRFEGYGCLQVHVCSANTL